MTIRLFDSSHSTAAPVGSITAMANWPEALPPSGRRARSVISRVAGAAKGPSSRRLSRVSKASRRVSAETNNENEVPWASSVPWLWIVNRPRIEQFALGGGLGPAPRADRASSHTWVKLSRDGVRSIPAHDATTTVVLSVLLLIQSATVKTTLKTPAAVYVCEGFGSVAVLPSPKSQKKVRGSPSESNEAPP